MQQRKQPLHPGPEPGRVAILRALQLGDMLCAVPALRALRAAWPGAEIVLIGLPWARGFVTRFGRYLDGFREFPGFPGLPERLPDLDRIPAFLGSMQAERFDLLLQMHGSGLVTNPLATLLGARTVAGYYVPGQFRPDPDHFLPYPEAGLEVDRLLQLVAHLGVEPQGTALEFPLTDADRNDLAAAVQALGLELSPGGYICVHPGASTPARQWPADRFAAVIDALAPHGLNFVLTGTANETQLTREVATRCDTPTISLAGRTSLGALGVLLSRARLLISNDTGVSHIADALRVPSVIISTGDNPARWAPRDGALHRVLCAEGGVPAQDVIHQARELLNLRRDLAA